MPNNIPPLGAPLGVPLLGQQQQQQQAAINQAVSQLSLSIYAHAATAHVATRDSTIQEIDCNQLRQLARDSNVAAKAFFEGLGVVEFDDK